MKHGEQVWKLEDYAPDTLRKGIEKLLADESLRLIIARGGYERAQTLQWPRAIEALETTYLN